MDPQIPSPPPSPQPISPPLTPPQSLPDKLTNQEKTLYSASAFEIFWKNLLAGAARTLGGLILYFIALGIMGFIFAQFVLPQIRPLFDSVNQLMEIQKNPPSGSAPVDPQTAQQLLKQFQQSSN